MGLHSRIMERLKGKMCRCSPLMIIRVSLMFAKSQIHPRPLLPSQLIMDREVELEKGVAKYLAKNNIHQSSCTENYYQTGARDTRANVELELFGQVIKYLEYYEYLWSVGQIS